MERASLGRALRAAIGVLVIPASALVLAPGGTGRASTESAGRPWLVYRTTAALPRGYSCADVPRRLDRLRTFPRGALPAPGGTANDPAWSPDGARIAFSSGDVECTNGDGVGQLGARIWVVGGTGRNLHAVTRSDPATGGPLDRSPSWSADGRRIAFARFDIMGGEGGMFVVGVDGWGLERISRRTAINLDWSPDGRSIAFVPGERLTFAESAADRVDLLDIGSGRVSSMRILEPDDLAWSPDGRLLAVTAGRGVVIVDRKLNVVRRIPVAGPRPPAGVTWAPDGRRIAYSDGSTIFTVTLDGRGVERVVGGLDPDWRP